MTHRVNAVKDDYENKQLETIYCYATLHKTVGSIDPMIDGQDDL